MILNLRDYIFGAAIIGVLLWGAWLKYENKSLGEDKKRLEAQITSYRTALEQAAKDANKSEERVKERIKYIKERSEPIYKYIETYKGDANATDCENNLSLLRSFTF